jgi:CHAT domain-containing protein
MTTTANTSQDYLNFLMMVLQQVEENPNPHIIYPFLQQNLNQFTSEFAETLRKWARANFRQLSSENSQYLATIINSLSDLMLYLPFGDRTANIAIAKAGYESTLTFVTRVNFPKMWAAININLGIAHEEDKLADVVQKWEDAINCYQNATQIFTENSYPEKWAFIQENLGNAYRNRWQGNKETNLQQAINYYQNALQILTPTYLPKQWGVAKHNLGLAYFKLSSFNLGESSEDYEKCLETAINHFEEALQTLKRDIYPDLWALCQMSLGDAYTFKLGENAYENHQKAQQHYENTLLIYTPQTNSYYYQQVKNSQLRLQKMREATSQDEFSSNDEFSFVYKALKLTFASEGDSQKVFTFLEENLDLLNEHFIENLINIIITLAEQERYSNVFIETLVAIRLFSDLIVNFPKGDRKINLDIAITGRTLFSNYCLEQENSPTDWADIQIDIGDAYYSRGMLGHSESSQYIEKAIEYIKNALNVYNLEQYRQKWSELQHRLGVGYSDLRSENYADNLESAIYPFNEALKVRTKKKYPYGWAITQKCLGVIYWQRTMGGRGDKLTNFMASKKCYEQALTVFNFDQYPVEWAETQHNLGTWYKNYAIATNHSADDYKKAISCFKETEKVFKPQTEKWAMVQFELGTCYKNLNEYAKMNKINLARSIECYRNALSVTDPKQNPFDWAEYKNSLGNVLKHNGQYKEAIECFEDTLKLHTRKAFPTDYMKALTNLGNAHVENNNLTEAFKRYQEAINTLEEDLLSKLATDDDAKRKLGEVWINLYQYMILVCLKLGKGNRDYLSTAWEYVERSKARRLVEIFGQTKPSDISDEIWRKFMNLRNEITNTEKWIEDKEKSSISLGEKSFNDSELTNRKNNLTNLKKKLTQKLENHPQLKQTQKVEYTPFSQIGEKFSDDNTVIIQWYILESDQKFCAFIYTRQSYQPYVWESSFEDLKNLQKWSQEYFDNLNSDQWRDQLPKYLERLAEILHIDELINYLPKNCRQVILIPHRYLHLFPIHALPVKSVNVNHPNKYFFECFTKGVRYAPSCQILLMLEKRLKSRNDSKFDHLFAVQNPTSNLVCADLEVEAIEKYFNTTNILSNKDAKKQKIIDNRFTSIAHCVHFSCHGQFKNKSPLESSLILANNEHLTLLDIFQLNLNKCSVVTLSACETGLTDLTSITDEYIGLPSGFLFAGSPSVVSSLWKVRDLSTSFLMMKFYEILLDKTQQISVPVALKMAQNWLKNLTSQQFILETDSIIDKLYSNKPRQAKSYKESARQFLVQNPEEYPFKNPSYWAAFIASGQ